MNGRLLMVLAVTLLALQDGFSRHLAGEYNTIQIVMIRYWFLIFVVLGIALRRSGIRAIFATDRPGTQALRGLFLAFEICVLVWAFVNLGLSTSHAIFAFNPLIIAALAAPLLGERVRPAEWGLIGAGFVGVIILIRPGSEVFSAASFVPLLAACLYAAYSLTTRLVADRDSALTSLAWTALMGVIVLTPLGLLNWQPLARADWPEMAYLAVSSAAAHWFLIRAYAVERATRLQPFAYLQLVFASLIGVFWFGEAISVSLVAGAVVVVTAGLLSLRIRAGHED